MVPVAPGRFSTVTACPHHSDSLAPITRATSSVPPPGGKPTIMRTGFVGEVCAPAMPAAMANAVANAAATVHRNSFIEVSWLSDFAGGRGCGAREVVHGGLHAFLLHWHAGQTEAHLHAGERA